MPRPSMQEGPSLLLECKCFQSCLSSWLSGGLSLIWKMEDHPHPAGLLCE